MLAERTPHTSYLRTLMFCLITGGFLRLFLLGRQNFWVDEMHTLGASGINPPLTYPYVFEILQGPLHALFLYSWHKSVGVGEVALRLPSAVASVLAILFFYRLARKLLDERGTMWATLIFTYSPFVIWYAQEVRNYSFFLLFVLLSFYYFLELLDGKRVWARYGLFTFLCVMSNLAGFFVMIVHGILFLLASRGNLRRLAGFIAVDIAVLAAFSPWILHMFKQMELNRLVSEASYGTDELLRGHTTFSLLGIPYTLFAFSTGYSFGPTPREIAAGAPVEVLGRHAREIIAAAAVFGLVAVRGVIGLRWKHYVGLLVWFAVPFALAGYFAVKNFKPFNVRYCMLALPAYQMILGRGLAEWKQGSVRIALAVLLFFLCGFALGNHYFDTGYQKDDFRSAARYLHLWEQPEDAFLIVGNFRPIDYYYEGKLSYRVIWEYELRDPGRLREEIGDLARRHARLWVLSSREWVTDPRGIFPGLVESRYTKQSSRSWPGARIDLYVVKAGSNRKEMR